MEQSVGIEPAAMVVAGRSRPVVVVVAVVVVPQSAAGCFVQSLVVGRLR